MYECGPSATYAPACWPKDAGQLYCMASPKDPTVRVFATTDPPQADAPSNEPQPWAMQLSNGAYCLVRLGGTWDSRDDGYVGSYSCTGGNTKDVVLVASTAHNTADTNKPLWTVAYGPLGLADHDTFPPPQRIAVTTAWFAVNRTPAAATTQPDTGGSGTTGTPVDPALYTDGIPMFKSPTGNVYCQVDTFLQCVVYQFDFQHPTPATAPILCNAAPAAAPNYGMIDASGSAGVGCQGDRGQVTPKVLPYGDSLTVGQYRCLSATTGVECVSTRTSHGIALSRAAMRVF